MIIPQPNTNLIINADSLTALKEMPKNSVDSVVTDPPYGLRCSLCRIMERSF